MGRGLAKVSFSTLFRLVLSNKIRAIWIPNRELTHQYTSETNSNPT
jgi:hypothetical protein